MSNNEQSDSATNITSSLNNKQNPYPKHIYDSRRIQLATELIQKEMRKLFPSAPQNAWSFIDTDISHWPDGGKLFHLESTKIQDFWDAFDAILGGIKLKPLFIAHITAANYSWNKRTLDPATITSSSILDQLKGLPFVPENDNHFLFADAKEYFTGNPHIKAQQLLINNEHSKDPVQDKYPIIAIEKDERIVVLDGNRRTLRAILQDSPTIEAWVAKTDGQAPRDYWMPVNHMMSLVFSYKNAVKEGGFAEAAAYKSVLKSWFEQSEVAKISYTRRVKGQNHKLADELSDGLL